MHMNVIRTLLITVAVFTGAAGIAGELVSSSPEGACVYFIAPVDGQQVTAPFTAKFGLKGMAVAPAGTDKPDTGHHHLLIDVDELPDLAMPLPANDHLKHFGKGQTETELSLSPGTHTLQLLLGNHLHVPHNPPLLSVRNSLIFSYE